MDLRRGLTADQLAALAGPIYPVLFAFADWPDDPVHAHSAVGTITWGGHDWIGIGPLGGVSIAAEEAGGIVPAQAVLTLIGAPADLDGRADDAIRGRVVRLYIGLLTGRPGDSTTLIGDPVDLFAGHMDVLDLAAESAETGVSHTAAVTVVTGPSARSRATIYHSDEDQRASYPGDTAGLLVALAWARAQKLTWPET